MRRVVVHNSMSTMPSVAPIDVYDASELEKRTGAALGPAGHQRYAFTPEDETHILSSLL